MSALQLVKPCTPLPAVRNKVCIPLANSQVCFCSFHHLADDKEHVALVFKQADQQKVPLVRIHSECITGDLFHSKRCDCGDQLQESMVRMEQEGGIILYLRQEGRGIGLYNKLDAYSLQLQGLDTYAANQQLHLADDLRSYKVAAQMLKALDVEQLRLLTNNPQKVKQLKQLGLNITERISTGSYVKAENERYLAAKKYKTGHYLKLEELLA